MPEYVKSATPTIKTAQDMYRVLPLVDRGRPESPRNMLEMR
jgi:hypothetical protein